MLFVPGKLYTQRSHLALFSGSLGSLDERYSKLVLLTVIDLLPPFILLRRLLTVIRVSPSWGFPHVLLCVFITSSVPFFPHLLQNIVIRKKTEEKPLNLFCCVQIPHMEHLLLFFGSTSIYWQVSSGVPVFLITSYRIIALNLVAKQNLNIKIFSEILLCDICCYGKWTRML